MIIDVELILEKYNGMEYLAYEAKNNNALNETALRLLENNIIDGVLPFSAVNREGNNIFLYNTSGRISVDDYLMEILNQGKLYKLFRGIANTLLEAKDYGLDYDFFIARVQGIFLDPLTDKTWMMYMPIIDEFEHISFKDFIRNVFNLVRYDYREDGAFFIKLNNYIKSRENFSIEDFKEKLDVFFGIKKDNDIKNNEAKKLEVLNENTVSEEPKDNVSQDTKSFRSRLLPNFLTSKKEEKRNHITEIEEELNYRKVTRKPSDDFCNEKPKMDKNINSISKPDCMPDNEASEGETSVLGVEEELYPYLISKSENQRFDINKEVIKIGRDEASVDYVITSPAVGRIHGEILTEEGEYYIKDNNSRNGTFLNNLKLEGNRKYKIKHEDEIKFANKEFVFRIY